MRVPSFAPVSSLVWRTPPIGLCPMSSRPLLPWAMSLLLLVFLPASALARDSGRPSGVTPEPVLPVGATRDMLPLPYKGTTVAGLAVQLDASLVTEYGGETKDVLSVFILGQGPTRFSMPRWNQGDYAPRLNTRRPFSQPNIGHVMEISGDAEESPSDLPAQAWRPSIQRGVVMGSVIQNGAKWNDSARDFFGTLACVYDSHGFGYNMDTGEFGNENPNINIAVGKLGLFLEGNIDTAIAWFPYEQGWVGGYVDAPGEYKKETAKNHWVQTWSFAPALPEDAWRVVQWDGNGALVTLPEIDSRQDGMLFLTSTNPNPGNNDLNTVSTYTEGRSWRVQVREDDQPIVTIFCEPDQAMFAFLYVPYSAGGLIGGLVDGRTGTPKVSRGDFVVRRVSEGVYHMTISRYPGLGYFSSAEALSNRDGMLLLQVMGHEESNPKFTRHTVLSYQIQSDGTIRIESHRLVRKEGGGVMDEEYPPADSDFYFAWVDFRTPLTPSLSTFTGRFPGDLSRRAGPGFVEGFLAASALNLLFLLVLISLLLISTHLSRRYSVLARAPLSGSSASEQLVPLRKVTLEAVRDPERGNDQQHDSSYRPSQAETSPPSSKQISSADSS